MIRHDKMHVLMISLVPFQYDYDACHCEERSDEAIPTCAKQSVSHENVGIASLRSQ